MKKPNLSKKFEIWEKIFYEFYPPPGVEQRTPKSQPRGNLEKIALMMLNNIPQRPPMPNFRSLLHSVWAVGGVAKKKVHRIFYMEETCKR